jgi:predicted nucleic acid-binding protein
MAACVVDATVTLAWVFDEGGRGTALDRQIGQLDLVAPWLWRLEMVNAVLVCERRREMSEAQGSRLLATLESLEIEIVGEPVPLTLVSLAHTARPHQLTAFDAVYLDLAVSLGLPLLCDDGKLRSAAERVGVPLIESA